MSILEAAKAIQNEIKVEQLQLEIAYWRKYGKTTEKFISDIKSLLIFEKDNEKVVDELKKLMYERLM